jgi:hypothetical protein
MWLEISSKSKHQAFFTNQLFMIYLNIALLSIKYFEEHDVNSWGETDVVEWIKKISHKHNTDLIDHSEKFLNHNINGKRLLLLTKEDLRNIGISSEGHIVDLYVNRIERIFDFPFYMKYILISVIIFFKNNSMKFIN